MSDGSSLTIAVANWPLMFISLTAFWFVLRVFSKRLGDALRMGRYYLLYDAGELLVIAGSSLLFIQEELDISIQVGPINSYTLSELIFLAGPVVMVLVTFKYWGWIIPEVLAPAKK